MDIQRLRRWFFAGVFTLVTGPLAFFIYALTARVALEFVVAVIRVAENTDKLVQLSSNQKP